MGPAFIKLVIYLFAVHAISPHFPIYNIGMIILQRAVVRMQKRHTCMYVICTPHRMHAHTHLNTHRHARAWCMQTAPCGCPLRNTFLPSPSFSITHSVSVLCPAPCWSLPRYLYILSTSHFMEKSGFPPITLLDLKIS